MYTAPNEVPESPDCTSLSRALSLMEDRVVDFRVREPSGVPLLNAHIVYLII